MTKCPIDARSFSVGQSFITAVKRYHHTAIFGALRDEYERRAATAAAKPETVEQVGALLADSATYRYFAWFERHSQRFKYAGRYGLVPWHGQRREELEAKLKTAPADRLDLDPGLEMPRYYEAWDIHQHPGGVWSDPVAGFVYQRAASTTMPLSGGKHADMHDKFADMVKAECPAPERILDMGCGFGKTTGPLAETFPAADVDGVDLSAPCLQVAALSTPRARYRQMDCSATDYPDGHFDVVASSMLLHEMPPPVVEKTLAEAARVLKPGGKMMHLDFHHLPTAFDRFMHYTHGRRNNEPFMEPLAEMDVKGLLKNLGFRNIAIEPFEEVEGALADPAWRFPWTVISAEKV